MLEIDRNKILDGDYIKDGELYCGKCNTQKSLHFEGLLVYPLCGCEEITLKQAQEIIQRQKRQARVRELKLNSLLGQRYDGITFNKTDLNRDRTFENAYEMCRDYCFEAQKHFQDGKGLYLYGDVGTGKTHLTACMIDDLSERLFTTYITNISNIARQVFKQWDFISTLRDIDFLFIDDIGSEKVQKDGEDNQIQQELFNLINDRYNRQLPTIFTSNYNTAQLITERHIAKKTIDRIFETCKQIEIKGRSYRQC